MAGNFLASSGGFDEVTTRIDNLKAETKSWTESTDNKAMGLWDGKGIPLIKSMFKHDTLLVRITPFNQNAQTVEFPITGIEEEIKPLRAVCKW
jgi:type VI secretion system protein VasI